MVLLLKHHALLCPACGLVQASSAKERARCMGCGHSWAISQKGLTIGVLGSYWRPQEAGEHVKKAKEGRAQAAGERMQGTEGRPAARIEAVG